ncbi:hypothetical protein CEXT_405201 [Caerostris extrusa]|uniref:Uncharacterized protein n=1 Tax=Caerostris extrusa TaxID=172846 RepID=A0AAV4NMP0_CAEEX|nr:hypothetical protein CEXT_405201 [Caerostris extrusa]
MVFNLHSATGFLWQVSQKNGLIGRIMYYFCELRYLDRKSLSEAKPKTPVGIGDTNLLIRKFSVEIDVNGGSMQILSASSYLYQIKMEHLGASVVHR